MTAPFTGSTGSGRQDALRPPTGGPGRPAPSFLINKAPQGPRRQAGAGPQSFISRAKTTIGNFQRPGGGTVPQRAPIARPTQSTIAGPRRPAAPTIPAELPGDVRQAGVVGQPAPVQQPPQVSGGAGPSRPPIGGAPAPAPPLTTPAPAPAPVQQPAVAPQPAPPAPAGPVAGNPLTPGVDTVPLSGLGGLIERQLANPSRFGSEEFQRSLEGFGASSRADEEQAANRARSLANARGVFFGSGGIREEERSRQPFQRGRADLANSLLLSQAQTGGQDLQGAIGNAFRFGENITSADQFAAGLGERVLGRGLEGAPSIDAAAANIANQPLPGAGPGPDFGGVADLVSNFQRPGGGGAPSPSGGGGVTGAIGNAIGGVNFGGGLGRTSPGGTFQGGPPPPIPGGVNFTGGLRPGSSRNFANRPTDPFQFNLRGDI